MVLEPQSISKDALFERLKCCLRAETLLQSTTVEWVVARPFTLAELTKTRSTIYGALKFQVRLLDLPEREAQGTYDHIDLALITDHTVTHSQFEVLFTDAPSRHVDYSLREDIWTHNMQCLLSFIRGYTGVLQQLQVMVDVDLYYADYLDNAHLLRYLLTTFHEVRTFFPFCQDCPQNAGQQCKLWLDVLLHLNDTLVGPRDRTHATALRLYFKGFTIPCPIPKTLEAGKQGGGL